MAPIGIMTRSLMTLSTLLVFGQAFIPINNVIRISHSRFDNRFCNLEKLEPLRYRNDDIMPLGEHGTAIISSDIYTTNQVRKTKTKYDLIWKQRFQELQEYFEEYGNYDVPNKVNGRLSRWIANQRRAYKSGKITQDRFHALQAIRFPWTRKTSRTPDSCTLLVECNLDNGPRKQNRPRKVAKRTPWIERFYQLKEFQELHGHCIVPQHYSPNPGLGIWVKSQRRQNKINRSSDKSSKMSSRIKKLNSIGFVWDVINKDRAENQNEDITLRVGQKVDQAQGYLVPFDFENKTSQQLHSAWLDRFNEFR